MTASAARRQYLIFGGVLVAICAALGIGYFLFLRSDYAVLASGLRAENASAIVAELDKRGTAYRIEDGGSTIRVPASEADATRVAIAGSDAAARGQIGFELFNKSDMGLTNFAQKINYQRALQGELVRTITAMDGVDTARVHLGLPERSLFRGERVDPSAAVTVTMKQGRIADAARVTGIQRLVAAAVPDLSEARVAVLDGQGRVISAAASPSHPANELDERQAIQAYYAARARTAIEPILGAGQFSVRALVQTQAAIENLPANMDRGAQRSFGLRLLIVTPAVIPAEDRAVVRDAAMQSIKADANRGDSLEFETGPLAVSPVSIPPSAPMQSAPVPENLTGQEANRDTAGSTSLAPSWLWLGPAMAMILVVGGLFIRRRAQMRGEEHEAVAVRLRRQLAITEEPADAQQ